MLHASDKPQILTSKEEPLRKVLVEFDSVHHYNALISETWCPLPQRLAAATEKACKKQVIVLCETNEEALRTAKYHFFLTGNNFKILQ